MSIEFTVNGTKCRVDSSLHPETTLNAYLRYHLGLPGTKSMCRIGICGACIVNVTAHRDTTDAVETFSVNSCLVLVLSCHGWDITTVEGVGNRLKGYSEVQKRFAGFSATQCGYCTPGFVMQLSSLINKGLNMVELENSFGCNTCRCTGYRPILDVVKSFAVDASPALCKKVDEIEDLATDFDNKANVCDRKCSACSDDNDWSIVNDTEQSDPIVLKHGEKTFMKVFNESHVFDTFQTYGTKECMLIDGNTGKGIMQRFEYSPVVIDISGIQSLKLFHFDQNLVLKANVSLEDCRIIFKEAALMQEFSYLEEFAKHFDLIAQNPVRKLGSLAGNVMLKHKNRAFQSDVFLLFEAIGATITIRDANDIKTSYSMAYFLQINMDGKLIVSFQLPPEDEFNHVFRSYKIMPRSQNALAIVNAAFNVKFDTDNRIDSISIVYGNIARDFIHASQTESYLRGKNLYNNQVLQGAIEVLNKEIVPEDNPPEPSTWTRKKLAIGLFYKFVLNLMSQGTISPRYRTGGELIVRPMSGGKQTFQTNPSLYPLTKPMQKLEAIIQSSGEAQYANDIPPMMNEVFGAFVLAEVYNGEVDRIDVAHALKLDGVLALFTAKDIPGVNSFTFPGIQLESENEQILVDKNIQHYGQPVGIIVAVSHDLAISAAKKVKVIYKNVRNTPPIITLKQAKKFSDRIVSGPTIEPKGRGNNVKKVIKGVFEAKSQYPYYMEPLTCIAVPVDTGLEIYDATQWMDLTQIAVSKCLKMPESDVHMKVRRIGGGFGGKVSRNSHVACASAIVARLMNRPTRFILPLETNIAIAGGRLPFDCEYEVGVDDDGKIQYLNASITEDAGYSQNENILDYVSAAFKSCYNIENFNVKTYAVRTDLTSNSYVRAPGSLEGFMSVENIMEHIGFALKKDPIDIRLANMRTEDNDLPELIESLKLKADYDNRLKEIDIFNKNNRWMKKALTISTMLYPVIYYGNYTAMVSIYRGDGTVTITTGGVEMGQGVNTKAAQVCSYILGIPLENIKVIPNYSFVAANNVFSGSSIVSECICYAIIKACKILLDRLKPIKEQMAKATWAEIIHKAGEEEMDLCAIYMMGDTEPDLKGYSAFGVSIIEVILDVLSGNFQINRCDISEDVGMSANPAVDIGQVEGAYVQGISYLTLEHYVHDKQTGKLLTDNALNYKVSMAKDIPVDFRVYLRENSRNTTGVLGSKAVGEMGICLSPGIIYALRQCIFESRRESGYDPHEWFDLDLPLTKESILKALDVKLEELQLL